MPLQTIATDTSKNGHYARATAIARWLKAAPSDLTRAQQFVSVYLPRPKFHGGNIAGYRTFHRIELHDGGKALDRPVGHSAVFSNDGKALLLFSPDGKAFADSVSLESAMRAWATAAGTNDHYALPDTAMALELRGKKSPARLYVYAARFDKRDMRMQSLSGLLFAK
jgi:hypothetical protein